MTNIVIINGANAHTSRVNAIQQHIQQAAEVVSIIEVHRLPAEDLLTADFSSEVIKSANQLVSDADIVVVLTPVYKAAYSGILKTYLDLIPQKGLEGKTILPIAVGGTLHHLLAIDYALKPVLCALGATNILQGVYVLDQSIQRKNDGFVIEVNVLERVNQQLQKAFNDVVLIN